MPVFLHDGDCLQVMKSIASSSIDSIVTDPPYGLSKEPDIVEVLRHWMAGDDYTHSDSGFMGKDWDSFVPGPSIWREALRVLKPGGHLLCFAGTRTQDLMGIALRMAGFEIRDCIRYEQGQEAWPAWIYATGFPKSLDVAKAIDKYRRRDFVLAALALGIDLPGRSLEDWTKENHAPGDKWWSEFKQALPLESWMEIERKVVGSSVTGQSGWFVAGTGERTAPATDAAKQWDGWGTALKPAWEPVIVARKPLEGNVAQNVLQHGTGALNIDACRIRMSEDDFNKTKRSGVYGETTAGVVGFGITTMRQPVNPDGRWPANLIHDGSEEAFAAFGSRASCNSASTARPEGAVLGGRCSQGAIDAGKAGSASRFFYCAKASRAERDGSRHPTVKPVALMAYLCKLVTPPGGTVLDPFAGSGSTGQAAVEQGFDAVLIEREPEYCADIRHRLALFLNDEPRPDADAQQLPLPGVAPAYRSNT